MGQKRRLLQGKHTGWLQVMYVWLRPRVDRSNLLWEWMIVLHVLKRKTSASVETRRLINETATNVTCYRKLHSYMLYHSAITKYRTCVCAWHVHVHVPMLLIMPRSVCGQLEKHGQNEGGERLNATFHCLQPGETSPRKLWTVLCRLVRHARIVNKQHG